MAGRWWARSACATALAAVALTAPPPQAAAEPGTDRPTTAESATGAGELLVELRALYQELGAASEAHRAAEEQSQAQRGRAERLTAELAGTRGELAGSRQRIGRMAREEYRTGGVPLSSALRLLLSNDPAAELRRQEVLDRAAEDQAGLLKELSQETERAGQLAGQARAALESREALARQREQHQEAVRRRLAEVEELLAPLTAEELAALAAQEATGSGPARREPAAGELLRSTRQNPSAEGARALDFALSQVGKPYRWGADGPDAFDGSGLTHWAWEQAGRTVPRAGRQQWGQLERVPTDRLRPGDLVVYFSGATHLALYAGQGMVVHSPPGGEVRVSPLAVAPVLGAVRPDADGDPLPEYRAPELPGPGAALAASPGEVRLGEPGQAPGEEPATP
ncbi:NlpC/P60 family protein [Streptomyces sp. ACA25]|uniref:C40 family peptidase n=1 Tax=Streptomyces sp. ACA25 TaxID=3022596 RepID=UPI002306E633|nr:NlpC/P60 family protein [Streptomyces sp. ACA25]MDB1087576.1 NlpC/P60 family protein [Streptomyces sp. ACA25]